MTARIRFRVAAHAADLPVPSRASTNASGFDLRAALRRPVRIAPGTWEVIPTGLLFSIPRGFEGQIRSRSGLASSSGVFVLNGVGTIDADYRGELRVVLANLAKVPFTVARGDRIAQLVICALPDVEMQRVQRLPTTQRGRRGFGSTGR